MLVPRRPPVTRLVARLVALLASIVLASGCGAADDSTAADSGRLVVVAAFYPLEFAAERVGGAFVEVSGLTRPGVEPHDLELSPADVARVADADLVVHLAGFQPAVDEATAQADPERVVDVGPSADLSMTFTPVEAGVEHDDEADTLDPHFWLDPVRLGDVATALADRFATADPGHAAEFRSNAAALVADLEALDADFSSGLASCEHRELVTSHNAFGYLAERYGLEQVGITGLTPEAEPGPEDLASITDFVRTNDVTTIYFETLVSPAVARAVADEAGATTAVLDPVEGLTDDSAGADYLAVMRSNLETLRSGQGCE